jgi:putative membrane protein
MGIQHTVHMRGFGGPFGPGNQGFGGFFSNGSGVARLIFMIGFVLLLAVVAYFFIRHFDHTQQYHHNHGGPTSSSTSADSAAAEVLKMRFAKGEIDEDEFSRRMSLLKDHQSVS